MWAKMRAQFVLDGPLMQLRRIDLGDRRSDDSGPGRGRPGPLARADLPGESKRRSFPGCARFSSGTSGGRIKRRRRLRGNVSPVQGRPRSTGTLRQRRARRLRLPVPLALRLASLDADAFEVYEAGAEFSGGDATFSYSIKPLGSKTRPTSRFEFEVEGRDLGRLTDFEQMPGLRFAGTARGTTCSSGRSADWPSTAAKGRLTVAPPAGVVPMSADAGARRSRPTPTMAATNGARSRRCRCRRTCRSPATSRIASGRTT